MLVLLLLLMGELARLPLRPKARRQRRYPAALRLLRALLIVQGTAVAVTPRTVDAHARLEPREQPRRRLLRGSRRRERVHLLAGLDRFLAQHRVQATGVLQLLRLVRFQRAQQNPLGLLRDLRDVLHARGTPPDLDLS